MALASVHCIAKENFKLSPPPDIKRGESENIMANINTNKNAVEIRSELNAQGVKIEYITINGQRVGILGSVSERDRDAALKALNDAYIASGGDILAMAANLTTIAAIDEKGIVPDEMIEVEGVDVIISYRSAAAYAVNGKELANCADIPNLPNAGVKALLIERVKNLFAH